MEIDTVENKRNADGKSVLTLSGKSLEAILEDRIATDNMGTLTANPNWTLTGTPAAIARKIFEDICKTGILSTSDRIPFLETVFTTIPTTVPEPTDVITIPLEHQSVYQAIKSICETYGLGFYLVRVGDKSLLRFKIVTGNDRTLYQKNFPPVVFSHELESLEDISELTSKALYKNVAHVFAKNGVATVYAPGVDASVTGFERRVMYVKHDGDETGVALTDILNQKGYEALAQARVVSAFDGEIPQRGKYKYGRDYFLGDLVELRNSDGVATQMRVTEQIFTSDAEGDKSYPTLVVDKTATVGSWAAATNVDLDTWAERNETWAAA
jgi:hypothetical protein